MHKFAITISILLLIISHSAHGDTEKKNLALDKGFSLDGIVLESSTFETVQEKFGANPPKHEGDAGESRSYNCYTYKKGSIEFSSSSEMNGGSVISLIKIKDRVDKLSMRSCKDTKVDFKKLKFENGIGLNSTAEELTKSLGLPKVVRLDELKFSFERDAGAGFSEYLELTVTLDLKKQVRALSLSKVTSN